MKKLLFLVMLFTAVGIGANAQDVKKEKVKKTSTIPQKIHNTFSKHKKYSGTKKKVKTDAPSSN